MSGFPTVNGIEVFRLPPDGYIVDFERPKQQKVLDHYLVFGIGGSLALIALLQRYYTKLFLSKGLTLDDGFMFLGWFCSVLTQALMTASIAQGGMCAHSWEMALTDFERYSLITYIAAPVYMLCNGMVKLSLLTFYLQLSPQKWFRGAVWASIVIVTLYTVIITFMMFFSCSPPRKAFDFKVVGGSCIYAAILYMATAVSNIVTDIMLFVLPIPMVYQLHMPKKQKIGAMVVFGIGSVTIATSVVRLVQLPPVLASTDPSWDAAPANVWTFIEANLFVICGSMPTLRKFFRHFLPRLVGSSGQASYADGRSSANHKRGGTLSRVSKQRNNYALFPDGAENEMQTFSMTSNNGGTTVGVSSNRDGERDDDSEKAIIQTRTYTVQYD